MSNRKSNFPTAQQPDVEPGEMGQMIERMTDFRALPRVTDAKGVKERIDYMFRRCIEEDVRPGVEMMALCIGVTRQTLLDWQREGSERGEIVTRAKQVIAALIESWGTTGKLNPAAFCFLLKNHFGYSDNQTVEFRDSTYDPSRPTMTPQEVVEDIKRRHGVHFFDDVISPDEIRPECFATSGDADEEEPEKPIL